MKAIVIGATGATGKSLVAQLLEDSVFTEVVVLVRRKYFESYPKLTEVVVDFNHLENYASHVLGDVAFSSIGTTLKAAGSKEAQWEIDVDYPFRFAAIARKNGIPKFVLLSGMTANEQSKIFYSRMKGALENKIKALEFPQLFIFQPGFLIRPNTDRKGEQITLPILKFLNGIGLFRKYQPLPVAQLAKVMIQKSKVVNQKSETVTMKEILKLL